MSGATRATSSRDRAPTVPLHAQPLAVVWERTGSRRGGLRPEEVAQRRTTAVRTGRGNTSAILGEIAESVVEPLQLLLVVVGALSAIFGELRDAIAIFSIILLVSAVEAISEVRAKRALRALRDLSAPNALVRRAGVALAVPVGALVVGDVLLVEAGSIVAADARVVEADGLATDESRLTGEPVTAAKGPQPVNAEAPLAERSSVLHAGTAVVAGAGEGVVVALGEKTEIGRLGQLVAKAKEPPTPLQGAMAELARAALIVAVTACVLLPLLGVLRGQPPREMLLDGLTLAFATIPEELPILVTVLVALGGLRLAQHGVLLRQLRAAEAVGAITVLLADKTGTLTENRLLVERIDGDRERVLGAAAAAHGAAAAQDPVDRVLVEAADEPASSERLARFPFDPVRRRESAVWCDPGGALVAVKGAPEAVLDACAMPETERASVLARAARFADDGLRIIAVAERRVASAPRDAVDAEAELDFIGLAGFRDPLRAGVGGAVAELAHAGVRTIV
ncbi:MAG: cation-transporting P-type ATPase, partial [Solirubrobacterales bacterium]|nr:cation-transporting P-type ATPase [Solirubrobacterales bacterium]